MKRCRWATGDLSTRYHDYEWGVPIYEDRLLFEFLILEGAQAGLSWDTILKKREAYREAYNNFNPKEVALYGELKKQELMQNPKIVRNRLKISASIANARAFLKVQEEFESFSSYIWSFVGGRPIQNRWKDLAEVPTVSHESEKMSKSLKKWSFKFVGPTICYAFMQATGMVNDHTTDCFRHKEIGSCSRKKNF